MLTSPILAALVTGHPHVQVLVVKDLPYPKDDAAKAERDAILSELIVASAGQSHPLAFLYTASDTHTSAYQLHTEFPPAFLRSLAVVHVEYVQPTPQRVRRSSC